MARPPLWTGRRSLGLGGASALILLDIHLPDLPGAKVLRCLREEPATQWIPVLVLSADATQARSTGCSPTKPPDGRKFLDTVEKPLWSPANPFRI